jgi:hypothetical protein
MVIIALALSDVWAWYSRTLVHYSQDGWVARAARTFRIFAVFLLAPFLFLTLLVCPLACHYLIVYLYIHVQDVTSYVIARTLDAVDATRAPTSAGPATTDAPTILVSQEEALLSEDTSPASETLDTLREHEVRARATAQGRGPYFFTPHEENSLTLSGVGVFSPAASRPGSPVLERRSLSALSLEAGSMRHRKNASGLDITGASTFFKEHNVEDEDGDNDMIVRRRTTTR